MGAVTDITTGEQTITTTGAVTGSLDTSALTGDYTVKMLARGLSSGKKMLVAVEDTANASAFSEAVQVGLAHFVGGMPTEGSAKEWRSYDIPCTRFGAANTKLRLNVLAIDGSPGTVKLHGWLEQ